MAFITREELKSVIRENHLNSIVDDDDTIIEMAISAATTEVRSRLTPSNKKAWMDGRNLYDVAAIFSAAGNDRNGLLLEITKVVAMWWIICRNNAGMQYEIIEGRYDRAIDYLKDLASGDANDGTLPILPPKPEADESKPFQMGSRRKFNHE